MRYYVVWPDGQRFGPAEVGLLKLWVAERRIGPGTVLEEETGGRQVLASQIAELAPVLQVDWASTPLHGGYRGDFARSQGSTEVILAWILAAIGLFCCPVLSVVAIVLSVFALQRRQPTAIGALICSVASLLLSLAVSYVLNWTALPSIP